MKTTLGLAVITTLWSLGAGAQDGLSTYSFPDLWKRVERHSPAIAAADHALEGARIQESRSARHFYPRIVAEGRVFSTSDPALTFMSLLGQRQIAAPDFAPEALREPGTGVYEHGTLALDLPLFEGGARAAGAAASHQRAEAKVYEHRAASLFQYAELAQTYASILTLKRERGELQTLADGVGDTLAHYRLGAKSNPVGYSGLLGLKTLRNRLEGLLVQSSAKESALRNRIRVAAANLPANWEPAVQDPREFITATLTERGGGPSASVRALRADAESLEKAKNAEKARFFPKLGLFGAGDLYHGSRGAATSYTAGAYVQWELFSAPNFGAVAQAQEEAAAAQARADGAVERNEMERGAARDSAEALEKNLMLLNESALLLEEQITTARGLFRNGSINALQLVEVWSQRADLLVSRAEAELALAQARMVLLTASGAEEMSHEN